MKDVLGKLSAEMKRLIDNQNDLIRVLNELLSIIEITDQEIAKTRGE